MKQLKVSIIILNWNGVEDTIECLDSLGKITYLNYEIIVIDNASSGEDVKILSDRDDKDIHLIANDRNFGFPEGCNIGIRYALKKGTDYILLLNNDTIVDPEFLTEMVKVAESEPAIGIVGSKVYYYYLPNRIQSAGGRIIWWLGYIANNGDVEDTGQYDSIADRDYLFGTSFLIKKQVIQDISYMDNYFFFGPEEVDYCTRAKRAGYKIVYVPKSIIWHKVGVSRAKVSQFPETRDLIKESGGYRTYKYDYRLFKTYCMPVLFVIPLFFRIVQNSLLGDFFRLLCRGDWQTIRRGILRRFGN